MGVAWVPSSVLFFHTNPSYYTISNYRGREREQAIYDTKKTCTGVVGEELGVSPWKEKKEESIGLTFSPPFPVIYQNMVR